MSFTLVPGIGLPSTILAMKTLSSHPSPPSFRHLQSAPTLLAVLALLVLCTSHRVMAADPAAEKKVLDIFEKHCADCHSEGDEEPLLSSKTNLGELIANADYTNKEDPDAGELLRRILLPANSPKRMPKSKGEVGSEKYREPLAEDEIGALRNWITGNAPKPVASATKAAPGPEGDKPEGKDPGPPPTMAEKGETRGKVEVAEVPGKPGSPPKPGEDSKPAENGPPAGEGTKPGPANMKPENGRPEESPAESKSNVAANQSQGPGPDASAPIDERVKFLFEEKCAECHRTKKKPLLHKDIDLASLLTSKYVENGEPEKSVVYQVVAYESESPDRMPASEGHPGDKGYREPLTSDEKKLIHDWIGGQSTHAAKREFIALGDMLKDINADLESQPESRRPFLRYLTLGNLYNITAKDGNPAESDAMMDTYRAGMSKMLNCLSYSAKITVPQPIDEARTCFRIDIRDYTIKPAMWEKIANFYPYGLKGVSARFENRIKDMTGSEQAYMRADWFTFATSQPPLYHEILELPETEQEFEKKFGVDTLENLRNRQAVRASFFPSGVSQTNRLVERHDLGTHAGAYWKSYDFTRNHAGDKQDLTLAPLGPKEAKLTEDKDLMFTHDGGEIVFHLPNGLMGGYLATSAGKRLNRAPIEIVQDKTGFREDGIVLNGISCIACHKHGLNAPPTQSLDTMEDQLGSRGASLGSFADQSAIKKLYRPANELQELVKQDVNRFEEAMAQAAPGYKGDEPVGILYRRFLKDILDNQFATEFWTDEKELKTTLEESEDRALHVMAKKLEDGLPFTRDTFLRHFEKCSEELGYTLKPCANLAYEEFGGEAVLGKTGTAVVTTETTKDKEKAQAIGDSDEAVLKSGGKVTITMDALTYKIGDNLGFTLKSDSDCFVRVVQFGADGSTTQLVPNKLEKDNKLTAGKERTFPGTSDNGKKYVMQTSEPAGAETVMLLVSKSQFRDAENLKFDSDSDSFRSLKRGGVLTSRGAIVIKAGEKSDDDHDIEVAKASVGYVLEKK